MEKKVKYQELLSTFLHFAEFHGLESSAGVVQAIGEMVTALQSLVRVAGVNEDELVTLSLISDLSYAWVLVDDYTPIMQVCQWITK